MLVDAVFPSRFVKKGVFWQRLFSSHFDIETMEPIEPPWQAIKEWIPDDDPDLNWFNQERDPTSTEPESYDQTSTWQPIEVSLDDGRILVLDDS